MNQNDNPLQRVFGCSRVFLPVIHPVDRKTALNSIKTAKYSGISVTERTKLLREKIHAWNQNRAEQNVPGDA